MPPQDAIVEELYRVFGRYDLGGRLRICERCTPEPRRRLLATTPVRLITRDLLFDFVEGVRCMGCDAGAMKHFLPGFFDRILRGEIPDPLAGLSGTLAELQSFDWRTGWPADEAAAVQAGFEAVAAASVTAGAPLAALAGQTLDDAVSFGLDARADIGGMLRAAAAVDGAAAARRIAAAIAGWRRTWETRGTTPLFAGPLGLEGEPEVERDYWRGETPAVEAWLRDPALAARLEAAFFASADPAAQADLSDALAALERR